MADTFDAAFADVQILVGDFQKNQSYYLSPQYQEQEARHDFIDKFWKALGWDVTHETQRNPYAQEVKVERGVSMSEGRKRADYSFSLAPDFQTVRFFVEAKKPSVDIRSPDSYFQAIRYGWNGQTPLAVLTDFEQLHILDCRAKPQIDTALEAAVKQYHYTDYADPAKFGEIYWLWSREAVADHSLENFVADHLKRAPGRGGQRRLDLGGFLSIDASFLRDLDTYRGQLAKAFHAANPALDSETLTEATQRVLDRLVFLRFLEDKLIEPAPIVSGFGHKASAWNAFRAERARLDRVYNGNIFKEHLIDRAGFHAPDDAVFSDLCAQLASDRSPYLFNIIPIHILGSIYERFLGNVIVVDGAEATVDQKPEVRKAGGVYYTPDYIVRYIVENTVGRQIAGKTPAEIAALRFADIACGSGSFLLGVYDILLRYHTDYYNGKGKARAAEARKAGCLEQDGAFRLSLWQKRDILLNNIWGVDIDAQAVEVAQLSLYLKLLEDETTASAHDQNLLHGAILPTLNKNIAFGNSLIGSDILQDTLFEPAEERKLNPMDFKHTFPQIMKSGGFDAIVGNPPYRMLQPHNTSPITLAYLRKHYFAADFKIDLFHLFLQRAVSCIKQEGQLGYIVPTTVLNNVYVETLRKWLMEHCCIEHISVAKGRVFADADVHTAVLTFRRQEDASVRANFEVSTTTELSPSFDDTPASYSQVLQQRLSEIHGSVWNVLVNDKNAGLIARLSNDFKSLDQVSVINRGLITGDRSKYFADTKLTDDYTPIIAGGDVQRYHTKMPTEFVLFQRPDTAGGCWDREVHFAPHKLVVRQIGAEPTASILREPVAVTGNIFTVRAGSIHEELYLLGILNSSLTVFFWRTMFADFKTSFPQVTIFSLSQVPIRTIDFSNPADKALHDKIVSLVEQMLSAKQEQAKALMDRDLDYWKRKCDTLDTQIDALVYALYGLTEEETAIVEGQQS